MTFSEQRKVTFSDLFGTFFELLPRHARMIGVYALGVGVPLAILASLVPGSERIAELVAGIFAGYLALEHVLGAEGLMAGGRGNRRFGSYFLASLLAGLGVVGGLVLFILPGLILMARWSIAGGIIVAEGRDAVEAMRESWEATRASQWSLVGFYLIAFLILVTVGGAIGGIGGFAMVMGTGGAQTFGIELFTSVLSQAGTACTYLVIVAIMRHLRAADAGLKDVFA